jgi:hypothetical protein
LLSLRRQAVELIQPLLQMLLLLWSQAFEVRIVLQFALLFLRRLIQMIAQPSSRWRRSIVLRPPGRKVMAIIIVSPVLVVMPAILIVGCGKSWQTKKAAQQHDCRELALESHFGTLAC